MTQFHTAPRGLALPALVALSLAAAAPAHAQERGAGTVYDRGNFPYGEEVDQPLTLPASLIRIDVPVDVNLTRDAVGNPVAVPASVDMGLTNDFQIGVFHAEGLCISGESHGCTKVYDDLGGRAVVGLSRSPEAQLALEVNLLALGLQDPTYRAGASLGYKRSIGNLGVTLSAGLASYLNKRDQLLYREVVFAAGEGAIQLGDTLDVFGRIGANRALDTQGGYAARFQVPVAVGVDVEPIRKLDVGLELGFPNLLGEDATADERELAIVLRLFI